jgi:hypothetical protein
MCRKYTPNSNKRSQLDTPEHGESRNVPLTPAERAKAFTGSEKSARSQLTEYDYGYFAKAQR